MQIYVASPLPFDGPCLIIVLYCSRDIDPRQHLGLLFSIGHANNHFDYVGSWVKQYLLPKPAFDVRLNYIIAYGYKSINPSSADNLDGRLVDNYLGADWRYRDHRL